MSGVNFAKNSGSAIQKFHYRNQIQYKQLGSPHSACKREVSLIQLHYQTGKVFILPYLKDKAEQIKDLLSDNGVGLMIFCSVFDQLNGDFPVVDIEFDCREVIHEMNG